jgi:diguanylate cyclase (GGDEF)-like protein
MQVQDNCLTVSIFEAAMRIHESLEVGEVITQSMKVLSEAIEAHSWAIYLSAEKSNRLELCRVINARSVEVSPFIDVEEIGEPVGQTMVEHKTTAIDSGEEDPLLGSTSARGALIIPLVTGQRLLGAVKAARAATDGSQSVFGPQELRLAQLICGSISRAVANATDYQNATRQTLIDDLTRLYNVRYLYQSLDNEIRRARRYGSAVSVVFMDLDGFKMVNDVYGHRAGSATLTEVAEVIQASVREVDFVARYGGDEFVIMMPETTASRAIEAAERVRARICGHRFHSSASPGISITASFGVASFPEHATGAEKLIELADAAMYEAKQRNKNNVRVAAP